MDDPHRPPGKYTAKSQIQGKTGNSGFQRMKLKAMRLAFSGQRASGETDRRRRNSGTSQLFRKQQCPLLCRRESRKCFPGQRPHVRAQIDQQNAHRVTINTFAGGHKMS